MKKINFIRLFILTIATACSMSLMVVENTGNSKSAIGSEKNPAFLQMQSEFIIWETMGQTVLSSSDS